MKSMKLSLLLLLAMLCLSFTTPMVNAQNSTEMVDAQNSTAMMEDGMEDGMDEVHNGTMVAEEGEAVPDDDEDGTREIEPAEPEVESSAFWNGLTSAAAMATAALFFP